MIRLEDILTPERIAIGVRGGSKKRVLEQVAQLVGDSLHELDMHEIFSSLIAREKLGSTGFGNGIAIPHCRLRGCTTPIGAIVRLDSPVDFDAIDGTPVDLVFALLVPEQATELHLQLLRQIAMLLDQDPVRNDLRQATNAQTLYDIVIEAQTG